MEKESEAGGKVGNLDSYEIEGGETKSEILQNLTEFQFSCVSHVSLLKPWPFVVFSIFGDELRWVVPSKSSYKLVVV